VRILVVSVRRRAFSCREEVTDGRERREPWSSTQENRERLRLEQVGAVRELGRPGADVPPAIGEQIDARARADAARGWLVAAVEEVVPARRRPGHYVGRSQEGRRVAAVLRVYVRDDQAAGLADKEADALIC